MTYLSFIIRTSDDIKQRVTRAGEIHPLLQWNCILYCILQDLLSSLLWYWNININQQNYCTCILQSMLREYCLMLYQDTNMFTRGFLWASCCSVCSFLYSVLWNNVFFHWKFYFLSFDLLWHLKIVRIVDKMMMISILY